mgnify:CR=1 FL=1
MQVRCGQCGTMFEPEGTEAPVSTAACPYCSHAVALPGRAADAQLDTMPPPHEETGYADIAREQLGDVLHVTCGQCGRHLTVGARRAGRTGRCPSCKGRIRIPTPDAGPEPQLSYRADTSGQGEQDRLDLASDWQLVQTAEEPMQVEIINVGRQRSLLAVALIVVLGAAIGLWIGMLSRSDEPEPEPTRDEADTSARVEDGNGGEVEPDGGNGEPPSPPDPDVGNGTTPVPPDPDGDNGEPSEPPPAGPLCRVLAGEGRVFAAGGYRPAPLGRAYWYVTAELSAGQADIRFSAAEAMLRLPDGEVAALGVAADRPLREGPAREQVVTIPAGESRDVTFVFEAPEESGRGMLAVPGFGPAVAGRLELSGRSGPRRVPATLVEQPPRNLRPLLCDPVMAALQAAPGQHVKLERAGEELRLDIPEADVAGVGLRSGPGLWDLTLRHGEAELACTLRFFEGGRAAVLYLADEPFHQVTYVEE